MSALEIYDFENDEKISPARKEACKLDYLQMELKHIDKIFTSAYQYDKKTGEPIAKKPRSIHELIYNLMKVSQALTIEIHEMKKELAEIKNK